MTKLYKVEVTVNGEITDDDVLYGFKAAHDNASTGRRLLVWFTTQKTSTSNDVAWDDTRVAFVTQPRKRDKDTITSYHSELLDYGSEYLVESRSGGGHTIHYDDPTHMAVHNISEKDLRVGLMAYVAVAGEKLTARHHCENPLPKNVTTTFRAVEKILLFLGDSPEERKLEPGNPVDTALSGGILIDASAADPEDLRVAFDTTTREWSWDGGAWARLVQAGEYLPSFTS
ncbi:hypothetical protein [Kitasatospora sp. NPDC056531]|uniref:hypothetical protein n=1 Tax=Kitasatospora sp. NPDC056531 TaxID=3345856 RepID=UPI003689C282